MKDLTAEQQARLKALASRPEKNIDLTDLPEMAFTEKAVVGKFYRPVKQSVSIRIDTDVLAWLKSQGEGYQTRINDYLRELMNSSKRRRRSS